MESRFADVNPSEALDSIVLHTIEVIAVPGEVGAERTMPLKDGPRLFYMHLLFSSLTFITMLFYLVKLLLRVFSIIQILTLLLYAWKLCYNHLKICFVSIVLRTYSTYRFQCLTKKFNLLL